MNSHITELNNFRYCHGKSSFHRSVHPSLTLRYLGHIGWNIKKNDFLTDESWVLGLRRPQHDGCTSKVMPQILAGTETRNSARLTDQRGSYAFSCSPFIIHVRHLLLTSNIKHVL